MPRLPLFSFLDSVRPGMREFLQDQGGRPAMAGLTTPIKNIGTGIHTLSILRIKTRSPTPILRKLAISGWALYNNHK
jgi:hypothetical protein